MITVKSAEEFCPSPEMRPLLLLALLSMRRSVALRVTLVRHGETEWNVQGRLQGASDSPLTDRGVAGATACGERLSRRQFRVAYTSPLPRARRTAELILAALPAPPALGVDARLSERSFGAWEGLTWPKVQSEFADELARADSDPTFAPSGGESRQETLDRAVAFMGALADERGSSDDHVLVVTHSATATCLIKHVLGLRQEQRRSFEVYNNALNEFRFDAERGTWRLCTLGDCAHLDGV